MISALLLLGSLLLPLASATLHDTIGVYTYTARTGAYSGRDALSRSIRGQAVDIDIYTGARRLFFEWDEKRRPLMQVAIFKQGRLWRTLPKGAIDFGHRWRGVSDTFAQNPKSVRYRVEWTLRDGKKVSQSFLIEVPPLSKSAPVQKERFLIYDNLEGHGGKAHWMKAHGRCGKAVIPGLHPALMLWVDDFFSPPPSSKDRDPARRATRLQPEALRRLIREAREYRGCYRRLDGKNGMIILDIEHLPQLPTYVAREYASLGYLGRWITLPADRIRARRIVSEAILKELQALQIAKTAVPSARVGLWNILCSWNRYSDNRRNHDDTALAKGSETPWHITYPIWHERDCLLYRNMAESLDFLMPKCYPTFDLSTPRGRERQRGYMLSKLLELKRLSPDTPVIPSLSPHYTEAWTKTAGLYGKALPKGAFFWLLEQMYRFYELGLIDGIELWGENEITPFAAYPAQPWWQELERFIRLHQIR